MLAIDKVFIFVPYFTLLFSNQLSSTHTYHFTLVLLLRDGEGSKKTYIRNKDSLKIVSTANLPNNQKLRTEDK